MESPVILGRSRWPVLGRCCVCLFVADRSLQHPDHLRLHIHRQHFPWKHRRRHPLGQIISWTRRRCPRLSVPAARCSCSTNRSGRSSLARARALEPIRALVAHYMRDLPIEIELADAIGAGGFEFVGSRRSQHNRRGCEHAGQEGDPKGNSAHVHCHWVGRNELAVGMQELLVRKPRGAPARGGPWGSHKELRSNDQLLQFPPHLGRHPFLIPSANLGREEPLGRGDDGEIID